MSCTAAWQLAGQSLDLNTPLPPELMMHHIAGKRLGLISDCSSLPCQWGRSVLCPKLTQPDDHVC